MSQTLTISDAAHHENTSFSPVVVQAHGLRQQRLYERLKQQTMGAAERRQLNIHFDCMPARYWERVTKSELLWSLATLQTLASKSSATPNSRSTVVAESRYYPERGLTKILICAWDRPGLLAKIAAAFSALRVNIVRADVYTRSDGVALDLFEVGEADHNPLTEAERMKHLVFLLEGALSEPPRFVSIWAGEFHKTVSRPGQAAVTVEFDNDRDDEHTVIGVKTADRLGLLHDLLRSFTECGLNVAEAIVETDEGQAADVFYVTDLKLGKILDSVRLDSIRRALVRAVAG